MRQTDVADSMGVRQGWVSDIEADHADREMQISTLQRYAAALGYRVTFDLIPVGKPTEPVAPTTPMKNQTERGRA